MVSSPNVPAVSKPYMMKIDMKKASANVASMLPFWPCSAPNVWVSTSGDWWLAKNSRMSAKTSIPRISVATPMLLSVATSRTPNALIRVVMIKVVMAMNVNMSLTPSGDGLARKSFSPMIPSTTKATMQATAVTVTTWAQK